MANATLIFEGNEIPLGGNSSGGVNFTPGDTMELSEENVLNVKVPNKGAITKEEYEQLSEEEKANGIYAVYDPEEDEEEAPQKSLYEQFVDRGYTGTEEEFDALIASGPWLPTSGGQIHGDISFSKADDPDDVVMSVDNESINGYVPMYMNNHQIKGVSTPSDSTDAANKGYVDTKFTSAGELSIETGSVSINIQQGSTGGSISYGIAYQSKKPIMIFFHGMFTKTRYSEDDIGEVSGFAIPDDSSYTFKSSTYSDRYTDEAIRTVKLDTYEA